MIYSFSDYQVDYLKIYFATSKVEKIGIDAESGKMIISFTSIGNKELRTNIIPRNEDELITE